MSYSLDNYPQGFPEFISRKPAPAEWQKRVQMIDKDLWIAWNPHHQDGERWCVVRFAGKNGFGRGSIPIIGGGTAGGDPFIKAFFGGWSFVRSLSNPDGTAAALQDFHVLDLFRDDYWRMYGRGLGEGAQALEAERVGMEAKKDAAFKKDMHEAWDDAMKDKAITSGATSVVVP